MPVRAGPGAGVNGHVIDYLVAAFRTELLRRREEIEGDADLTGITLEVRFVRGDLAPRCILFSKSSEKRLTEPARPR